MKSLPGKLINFVKWWMVRAPKRISKITSVVLALINNELSFTLNLKLLFTPLFGDYSIPGRMIGFIFRVSEIIVGSLVLLLLFLLSFILPVLWWLLPVILFFFINLLTIPVYILIFLGWFLAKKDIPDKRVNEIKNSDIIKSFRPNALNYLNLLLKNSSVNILPKLVLEPGILLILNKAELSNKEFLQKLVTAPSLDINHLAEKAYEYAVKQAVRYVELEHLFLSILANLPSVDTVLTTYGANLDICANTVKWILDQKEALSKIYFWQEDYEKPRMGGIGKGMTGRVTPMLNTVSEDFTYKVKKGLIGKIIGRKEEVKKIAELLSSSKVNILIIGEPGSGKTAIVKGIAYEIYKGTEFESIKFKRIVSLEIGALIAGTKTAGDVASRLTTIMNEIESSGDIVLFIDEIQNLITDVGGGGNEMTNVFSILEPHLAAGKVQFIGATNIENYRKYVEPNGSFARLFELIEIPQASKEDTLEILKYVSRKYETKYGVIISYKALQKVIELSDKLIHERVLPDKAIDILDRASAASIKEDKYITAEDIAKEISEITHVPVTSVTQDESQKLLNIENELKKRVIGQDQAIVQIGSALKRARVGIRNENKPIASFLFAGTTGVGKTETAKALAQTYFGNAKTMVRLDMSEYQQADSIDRLLGSPDGKSKGILTEAVRTSPFALVLLDEIEKAYSNILLTFLQVLDDGRITDSGGKVIDFTNTIVIATSNVGTKSIQEITQRNGAFEEMQETAMKEVRERFAPEFLNRFNGIIVFRPLDMESVRKIADIMLDSVRKLSEDKGVKISFKPELIEELIKQGFSPEWGARPLARVIENTVESYLAVKFLSNEIKQGDTVDLGMEVFK